MKHACLSEVKGEISFIHVRGIWYTWHAALPTGSRDGNVEVGVGAECKAPPGATIVHSSGWGPLIKTHCLYSLQQASPSFSSFWTRTATSKSLSFLLFLLLKFPGVLLQKLSGNSLKIMRNGSLVSCLPDTLSNWSRKQPIAPLAFSHRRSKSRLHFLFFVRYSRVGKKGESFEEE